MNISELYTLYKQCPVVSTDSRTCPPGALFFALKGEFSDGNAYAEKALQAGCSYAVIDDASVRTGERMIRVDNVLETLQQLARLHRETLGVTVIGITGTNGKTTTKELTAKVLSKKYSTLFTEGNLNNHIGVPLTLLRLTGRHEIAVVEMGANHPGEIRDLAEIARPDYGLVTNVGYAHLEGFGSFEGVVRTKGELYDFIRKNGGKVFIDRNNTYLMEMAAGIEKITYGKLQDETDAEDGLYPSVTGEVIHNHPFLSFRWQRHIDKYDAETEGTVNPSNVAETHLAGDYNLYNALAAIATGIYFGIPPEQINEAISTYVPANNRSQLKKTASNTLIVDAYNANPSSMKAALENFTSSRNNPAVAPAETGMETGTETKRQENIPGTTSYDRTCASLPKAVILGDMLELGRESHRLHEEIISLVNSCGFDKVLLCGERFSAAGQRYSCFKTVDELNGFLKANPMKGFEILIKGSHGIHLEKIIENL
ncbi:MAG: UDP-N-acetylmuramoyl-tripeptide--D-alanyl-D-alanine ligase [Tannerella sp.]|jgi:UDP-N-acetylmuramoyl-tripeptide--D-alanyl-D-alanine ligase|nr:UDP-N-acetylmuramoyl-tripeptide--D-alanyl-D-alanine ligase [Tannerella sp.]